MLHYSRLEGLVRDKHSSLFGPKISVRSLYVALTLFYYIYVVLMIVCKYERIARDEHSSLIGPFASYEEYEVL